jgi:hypothetical protein
MNETEVVQMARSIEGLPARSAESGIPSGNTGAGLKTTFARSPLEQSLKYSSKVLQGEIPRTTTLGLLEYFNDCSSGERAKVVFNPAPLGTQAQD